MLGRVNDFRRGNVMKTFHGFRNGNVMKTFHDIKWLKVWILNEIDKGKKM